MVAVTLHKTSILLPHFFLANYFPIPHFNKASSADPETLLYFDETMDDIESKSQWIEAAEKEIKQLEEKGNWIEFDMTDAPTKDLPGWNLGFPSRKDTQWYCK